MYSNTQISVDYSLEKLFEYISLTATLLSIILPRTFVFCTPLYILKSDMYKHNTSIHKYVCQYVYLHKSSCSVTNNKNHEDSENKTSTEQSTLP